jgi:hypothetical protein
VANGRRIVNINSAFPSNYLKASDLNGAAVPVTIREVKMEEVGRTKDSKPVVYFMGKEKGFVLNRTNAKKIAELAGSQDTEDWGGTVIALYPTETEFAGDTVECIRVKAPKAVVKVAPKPEPVADLNDDDIQF